MTSIHSPAVVGGIAFACPRCHSPLEFVSPDELSCREEKLLFHCVGGIWHFLDKDQDASLRRFVQEYETVRRAEGRGARDPAYYRSLPFEDLSGRFIPDWRFRAVSFQAFLEKVLEPVAMDRNRALKILDLGAGNGWLSNRLAERGHRLAAVDLITNEMDGLGAHIHYTTQFVPIQAHFSHLPLAEHQFDLAIFNASFHYSTRYEDTLQETFRVLLPAGQVVILDTPIYSKASSGARMVREREAIYQRWYGFPSTAIPSENYLTGSRLAELAEKIGLRWQLFSPAYGFRWKMNRWISRLRSKREPARFSVIVGWKK